ncbi:hypothetical protein MLD52_20750 [Puniceicoccaceae bacterium K14]|nr:hypothetical protein [Puniceicoccaceae bacterium K14]
MTAVLIAIGLSSYALAGHVEISADNSYADATASVPYWASAYLYVEAEGNYTWAAIWSGSNLPVEVESYGSFQSQSSTVGGGTYDLEIYSIGHGAYGYASVTW